MGTKLIACKDCKAEISKNAKTCPKCGTKNKKSHLKLIVITIGILYCVSLIGQKQAGDYQKLAAQKAAESNQANPALSRQTQINKQFSSWNGAHRNVEKAIKRSMNDPDSYEHVETTYKDNGTDKLLVTTKFRGKNAFGGKVLQTMVAEVDLNGNILVMLDKK